MSGQASCQDAQNTRNEYVMNSIPVEKEAQVNISIYSTRTRPPAVFSRLVLCNPAIKNDHCGKLKSRLMKAEFYGTSERLFPLEGQKTWEGRIAGQFCSSLVQNLHEYYYLPKLTVS